MVFDPRSRARAELDRGMSRAASDAMHDQSLVCRLVWRAITLPFWAPFWLRAQGRKRREFRRYVRERREHGVIDSKRIALEWAKDRPRDFPLGEYDPGLKKLEARVNKVLDRLV